MVFYQFRPSLLLSLLLHLFISALYYPLFISSFTLLLPSPYDNHHQHRHHRTSYSSYSSLSLLSPPEHQHQHYSNTMLNMDKYSSLSSSSADYIFSAMYNNQNKHNQPSPPITVTDGTLMVKKVDNNSYQQQHHNHKPSMMIMRMMKNYMEQGLKNIYETNVTTTPTQDQQQPSLLLSQQYNQYQSPSSPSSSIIDSTATTISTNLTYVLDNIILNNNPNHQQLLLLQYQQQQSSSSSPLIHQKSQLLYDESVFSLLTVRNALIIIFYSVIILVSLTGNSLVCKVAFGSKEMRTITNLLIASLACSDIVMTGKCLEDL